MTALPNYPLALRGFIFVFVATLSIQAPASENVLFEEDFKESPVTSNEPAERSGLIGETVEQVTGVVDSITSNRWKWDREEGTRSGMMIAPGDIYEIVEGEERVSHGKALRLNFSGRNNFCNTCGGDYVEVVRESANSACVEAPGTQYESFVYNLSNDFSTWNVTQFNENTGELCFDTSSVLQESIGSSTSHVKLGDAIYLPKKCGVSGVVGNDVNRRSDCSKAVNYLQGISSEDLGYGQTIARRFYIYIPSETALPDVTFKLGYTRWYRNGKSMLSTVKISTQRDRVIELTMPNGERTRTTDSFHVPYDKWVYIEEVFKRESSEGATDASYTLYAHEAGKERSSPLVTASGFELGTLRNMSVGGNWQHYNKVSGYVYFDNIMVAKEKIGPINRPAGPSK